VAGDPLRTQGGIVSESLEQRLARLRGAGWRVAVHNDYMQAGALHTFWAFSRGSEYVKGEGLTDDAAITEVEAEILALQCVYLGLCLKCRRFHEIVSLNDPRLIEHGQNAAPSTAYLREWEARWHEASDATRRRLVAERQAKQPTCEGSGTAVNRIWVSSDTTRAAGIDIQQALDPQQSLERATTAMTEGARRTIRISGEDSNGSATVGT